MKLTPSLKMALASLPPEIQQEFTRNLAKRSKSLGTAYIAWLFFGWHYLYLGRVGMQFAFWFTCGFLVVGWFIDFFRLPGMVARVNEDMALELIGQYKVMHSATPQAVQSMITPPVESSSKTGFLPLLVKGFLLLCLIGVATTVITKNREQENKNPVAAKSKDAPNAQTTAHNIAKTKTASAALSVPMIAADRSLWPKVVSLNEKISISVDAAGNVMLPAGSSLQLVSVGVDGGLEILWNSIRAKVPADKTNIVEAATQIHTRAAKLKAAEEARAAAERKELETPHLEITNLIIKKVITDALFEKNAVRYRYFFNAKNKGAKPFIGSLKITLLNKESRKGKNETFTCNIQPGLNQQGYIDSAWGPGNVDDQYSIAGFTFKATVESGETATGSGTVLTTFENTTR